VELPGEALADVRRLPRSRRAECAAWGTDAWRAQHGDQVFLSRR